MEHSTWIGSLKLDDGTIVPLTLVISDVVPISANAYIFDAKLNGVPISPQGGACAERVTEPYLHGIFQFYMMVDSNSLIQYSNTLDPSPYPAVFDHLSGAWGNPMHRIANGQLFRALR